jgi:hypothetical protein
MTRKSRPIRNPAAPSAALRPQPLGAQTQRRSSAPADSDVPCVHPVSVAAAAPAIRDRGGLSRSLAGGASGGGGSIWLNEHEGARIREATKDPMRRVSSLGRESYSKRARRAAAGSDDDDGEFHLFLQCIVCVCVCVCTCVCSAYARLRPDMGNSLSWKRKTGALPPIAHLGFRDSNNLDTDSVVDGESHVSNVATPPEECGSGSGIGNAQNSSGETAKKVEPYLKLVLVFLLLGPYAGMRFSTFRRVAPPNEEVASSKEDAEAGSGLTPEQPPGGEVGTEEHCTPSLPEPGAGLSECADVNMDIAHEVAAPLSPPPELPRVGVDDCPDIDSRDPLCLSGTQGLTMYGSGPTPDSLVDGAIDDNSDSDVPLAAVVSRLRSPRKRSLEAEESPSNRKDKGKTRADAFVSADVDASREEVPLGESYYRGFAHMSD